MAARALSAPTRHRERPTQHLAPRGAPGAEGDRSRIQRTPAGVSDGHRASNRIDGCANTTGIDNRIDNRIDMASKECCAVLRLCIATIVAAILASSAHAHHREQQRTTAANFTVNHTALTQQAQNPQQNFTRSAARAQLPHTRRIHIYTPAHRAGDAHNLTRAHAGDASTSIHNSTHTATQSAHTGTPHVPRALHTFSTTSPHHTSSSPQAPHPSTHLHKATPHATQEISTRTLIKVSRTGKYVIHENIAQGVKLVTHSH